MTETQTAYKVAQNDNDALHRVMHLYWRSSEYLSSLDKAVTEAINREFSGEEEANLRQLRSWIRRAVANINSAIPEVREIEEGLL